MGEPTEEDAIKRLTHLAMGSARLCSPYEEADMRADLRVILASLAKHKEALEPFGKAGAHVPGDVEDFKVVALVPGGHNAAKFNEMSRHLTAGNFRRASNPGGA